MEIWILLSEQRKHSTVLNFILIGLTLKISQITSPIVSYFDDNKKK